MPTETSAPPTRCVLERTGELVPFMEINIGEPFYFMEAFWTRTDYQAGADLRNTALSAVGTRNPSYGACGFGISEESMTVERVTVTLL